MTAFHGHEDKAFQIRGWASLLDFENHDFSLLSRFGEFNAAENDLGKEWITGPTPARFVLLAQ